MKLCILCEDSKVDIVRKKAETIMGKNTMKIKLSPNGLEPQTHWFCVATVTQEGYDKIQSMVEHSTIEVSGPNEFLENGI